MGKYFLAFLIVLAITVMYVSPTTSKQRNKSNNKIHHGHKNHSKHDRGAKVKSIKRDLSKHLTVQGVLSDEVDKHIAEKIQSQKVDVRKLASGTPNETVAKVLHLEIKQVQAGSDQKADLNNTEVSKLSPALHKINDTSGNATGIQEPEYNEHKTLGETLNNNTQYNLQQPIPQVNNAENETHDKEVHLVKRLTNLTLTEAKESKTGLVKSGTNDTEQVKLLTIAAVSVTKAPVSLNKETVSPENKSESDTNNKAVLSTFNVPTVKYTTQNKSDNIEPRQNVTNILNTKETLQLNNISNEPSIEHSLGVKTMQHINTIPNNSTEQKHTIGEISKEQQNNTSYGANNKANISQSITNTAKIQTLSDKSTEKQSLQGNKIKKHTMEIESHKIKPKSLDSKEIKDLSEIQNLSKNTNKTQLPVSLDNQQKANSNVTESQMKNNNSHEIIKVNVDAQTKPEVGTTQENNKTLTAPTILKLDTELITNASHNDGNVSQSVQSQPRLQENTNQHVVATKIRASRRRRSVDIPIAPEGDKSDIETTVNVSQSVITSRHDVLNEAQINQSEEKKQQPLKADSLVETEDQEGSVLLEEMEPEVTVEPKLKSLRIEQEPELHPTRPNNFDEQPVLKEDVIQKTQSILLRTLQTVPETNAVQGLPKEMVESVDLNNVLLQEVDLSRTINNESEDLQINKAPNTETDGGIQEIVLVGV